MWVKKEKGREKKRGEGRKRNRLYTEKLRCWNTGKTRQRAEKWYSYREAGRGREEKRKRGERRREEMGGGNKGEGEGRERKREKRKKGNEKRRENRGTRRVEKPLASASSSRELWLSLAPNTWYTYLDPSEPKCHRRTSSLGLITKSTAFPDGCFCFCRETKEQPSGVLSLWSTVCCHEHGPPVVRTIPCFLCNY